MHAGAIELNRSSESGSALVYTAVTSRRRRSPPKDRGLAGRSPHRMPLPRLISLTFVPTTEFGRGRLSRLCRSLDEVEERPERGGYEAPSRRKRRVAERLAALAVPEDEQVRLPFRSTAAQWR